MVSFKAITSALALATGIAAQATPTQVVADIESLTTKTLALQPQADMITLVNGPLIIIGQGPFPKLIQGFVDIVQTGSNSIQSQKASRPVPAGADADAITKAWTRVRFLRGVARRLTLTKKQFSTAHSKLLNTMTQKAKLLNTVPLVGAPIAAVLRQDDGMIDVSG